MLSKLESRRDLRSPTWNTGLPLFKTGGGGRHEFITRAVLEADDHLITVTDSAGIQVQSLPTLETLALSRSRPWITSKFDGGEDGSGKLRGGSSADIKWRDSGLLAEQLGVAYGLSFEKFEIGDVTPPHETDDVPPLPRRKPIEYISKDQV